MHLNNPFGSSKRSLISKVNSTVLFAAGLTAVIVSVAIVTCRALVSQRAYQDRVITKKQLARDTLVSNVADAAKLEESFNALEKNVTVNSRTILNALPSKYDVPALGSSIEKIVSEGGYKLESFTGEDTAEVTQNSNDPEAAEIPFTVEISGNYDAIKRFTNDLQRSIRPFKILTLTVTGQDNNLRASYKIVTYYQPAKNLEFKTEVVK